MAEVKPQSIVLDSEEKLALWDEGRDSWNAYAGDSPGDELKQIGEGAVHSVLKGAAAMALWRRGKESWNAWVEANPRADIDFSGQEFNANGEDWPSPYINFTYFEFPDGEVSFSVATFGDGHVSFDLAKFGDGHVSFALAKFGEGNVSFGGATFGKGRVSFRYATFGEGDVSFEGATFGDGHVSFEGATFGDGHVSFEGATFGDGHVSFDNASLSKGNVDFTDASFGPGAVSLRNLAFEGIARFDDLKHVERCTQFSFEGCSFDKLFTFSQEGRMGCPLDLRRTKLSHGIVLHDVQCDFVEEPVSDWTARISQWCFGYPLGTPAAWPWLKKAADREDSQRFRRLKELAQNENNRAKALEFNAQELRSQRGHESHPLQDFLQFFYMLLSDYGRSVVRPLVAVGVVTGLYAALYALLSTKLSFGAALPAGFTYSGGNMFAFVPIGRNALEQSRMDLFGDNVPYELLWVGGFQSVLSVILLFLLGLGLRNMFRL